MKINPVNVEVITLECPKCPRCYWKAGIKENFMELCDRCCDILLDAKEDLVKLEKLTQDEADRMEQGIKDGRLTQLAKYKNEA